MPNKQEGLQGLLVEGLKDLYDAEKQLVRALPKMAKASEDSELENAFREHLEVTKRQVERLERIFESMDMRARSRPCAGMKGIVEEGQEHMQEEHETGIRDSVVCLGGRKVEHYEMAAYTGMHAVARQLGMRDAAQLLEETLREEVETDKHLAQISKRLLKEASSASRQMEMSGEGAGANGGHGRRGASSRQQSGREQSASQRGGSQSRGRRTAAAQSAGGRGASSRGSSQSSRRSQRGGRQAGGEPGHSAHPLTDHEQIRQWAEERGARPTCVRGTGGRGDTGMIRLDFPGYSGERSLSDISWDDWFQKFDENNLALMVQDTTSRGERSNFNKIVSRETAMSKEHRPKARGAH